MFEQQQRIVLSPYMEIYDWVIPKDNLLRQIKELVDFGFNYDELIEKYCSGLRHKEKLRNTNRHLGINKATLVYCIIDI